MKTVFLFAALASLAVAGLVPTASAGDCEPDPNLDSFWLAYRPSDMHVIGGYDPNVDCDPVHFDMPIRIDVGP